MTDQELGRKLEKLLADQPKEITTTDLYDLLKEQVAQNRELRDEAESWAETVEEWKDLHKLSEGRNRRLREALVYIADHSLHPDLASGRASHALEEKP